MSVKLSPVLNDQQFSDAGILLSGGKIETYLAGSSTPAATFTTSAGNVAQANPIILNTRGEVDNLIYLTTGIQYKLILKDAGNNVLRTYDNIEGVNDASLTIDQWVSSGVTPNFVNATQFTLAGDQTTEFHVNRRVKLLTTAGTVYGYISASAFTTLTTVTVVLDSGVLDSGLSSVQLGLITPTNTSLRVVSNMLAANAVTTAKIADANVTPAKLSTGGPTWDTSGFLTVKRLVVDNASADGGEVVFKSAGFSDWVMDSNSGKLRAFYGVNEYLGITSAGLFQFNSGYGSLATAYGCRAWVNFVGTGTVTMRGAANVSSITDNGTGDYTVNFSTAMPDVNYATQVTSRRAATNSGVVGTLFQGGVYTTTQVRVASVVFPYALEDGDYVNVSVFR